MTRINPGGSPTQSLLARGTLPACEMAGEGRENLGGYSQRWETPLLCDLEHFHWIYWRRKWPNAATIDWFAVRAILSLCSHTKPFPSATLLGGWALRPPRMDVCLWGPHVIPDVLKRILGSTFGNFANNEKNKKIKKIMVLELFWPGSQKMIKAISKFHCKRGKSPFDSL